MPALQYCTFYLDRLLFGVELKGVQEVIRSLEMTKVPLAPKVVSGLINLRGQIVTAVDLRRRLELEARPPDTLPMNVVVRSEDGAVSFLVDEIGDVVEVEGRRMRVDALDGIRIARVWLSTPGNANPPEAASGHSQSR